MTTPATTIQVLEDSLFRLRDLDEGLSLLAGRLEDAARRSEGDPADIWAVLYWTPSTPLTMAMMAAAKRIRRAADEARAAAGTVRDLLPASL